MNSDLSFGYPDSGTIEYSLNKVRSDYERFILECKEGDTDFRFTLKSDASAFARCFGLFGLNLIGSNEINAYKNDEVARKIKTDLDEYKKERLKVTSELVFDKPYQQLLCFSLSALSMLSKLEVVSLEDHVRPYLKRNIQNDLEKCGALEGIPSSGNLAMFMAILRIYARDVLGEDTSADIDLWIKEHLMSVNSIGFWENRDTVTYSQFQNGYHQYEIFEYLHIYGDFVLNAGNSVAALQDKTGHFAPYPGGGGCYDYDAGSILLLCKKISNNSNYDLPLIKLMNAIISKQNDDGGFSETNEFKPVSLTNMINIASHIISKPLSAFPEKLYLLLSLIRPKHDRISTHWTKYSREWGESNLWDSWFRAMIVARIQRSIYPEIQLDWNNIDFPGIGYF